MNTQTEEYYQVLNNIEKSLPEMAIETAEALLEETFQIKPVRLKWYLVKAQVMLKKGTPVEEIIEFLSDKCAPWYDYDNVNEYFEMLSELSKYKGDILESKRYRYKENKMNLYFHGGEDKNHAMDAERKKLVLEMEKQGEWQQEQIERLRDLYYISGNIYLYLLWQTVINRLFDAEALVHEWILKKFNVGYYYERLLNDIEETFVVMASNEAEEKECQLIARALKSLKKQAIVFSAPVLWEENEDIKDAVLKSVESIAQKEDYMTATVYYLETPEGRRDSKKELLEYVERSYSPSGVVMILGSGILIDQTAMDNRMKPKFERLTDVEADYMEENMAVARYGDYLAYISNIYLTSKEEVKKDLYKKPTCRFSIIIPCRNAGNTLYYTLKTCLNQSFQGEYEIVISDNSDRAWGADTPTYQICQKLNDSRIKYYRAPRDLSLMKNFEYGYLKAEGEFLLSMGADDGILPWALEELDSIITEYPQRPVWLWHEAFYKWAEVNNNIMAGSGKAILNVENAYEKGSPNIFQYATQGIFQKAFTQYAYMYYLPQIYHNSGIRREYLATLYEKTGVLWAGISQDMCMAVTVANVEQELGFIDNLLTITGISNASIGANCRSGTIDLEQETMEKKMQKTFSQGWHVQGYMERLFPIIGTEFAGLYACIMYAFAIGAIPEQVLEEADAKVMYEKIIRENDKKNILFDSILHRIRYAVSLQGEELLEWFDNNFYYQCLIPESVKKEDMNRSKEEYNESIVINNQMIGAEKGSIKDVYEVSLFLEKFFAKENRNGESV